MKIRKLFRVESGHIVRNCTSHRCSHSMHGHSAVIEVILEGSRLDNAQMLYDFGLMKGSIKEWIDGMDHCYLLCSKDNNEFKDFIVKNNDRYIMVPFNPSAEMLSLFIFVNVQNILDHTTTSNGETSDIHVSSVRYHETTTGYAECTIDDVRSIWRPEYNVIEYSGGVARDFSQALLDCLTQGKMIVNPKIEQQIDLEKEIEKDETQN